VAQQLVSEVGSRSVLRATWWTGNLQQKERISKRQHNSQAAKQKPDPERKSTR